MWGSRLIDTLEDKRRSCENSEESKKESVRKNSGKARARELSELCAKQSK